MTEDLEYLQYLPYHLEQAGMIEELQQLQSEMKEGEMIRPDVSGMRAYLKEDDGTIKVYTSNRVCLAGLAMTEGMNDREIMSLLAKSDDELAAIANIIGREGVNIRDLV